MNFDDLKEYGSETAVKAVSFPQDLFTAPFFLVWNS